MNIAYVDPDGQVKMVLCNERHEAHQYLRGYKHMRTHLTDQPCDRCVREGRQMSEVR